ncbi:GNAT family N-acetyltransferase [Kineosporia sp. J2-2]|uniref:GNAT family N-acetyltransferase n=1 Tax=Kineosporia corallincola TaxID=2835133 RepID=A0ABS5TJQ0_9ACTN|nr:GNAT family N-acetyltransferase [Kineosporia corallincola]MBT0770426.1 GNAT family N-acetyltransferase [Kineosporia corallincola]
MKPASSSEWAEHVGSRVVVRLKDASGLHDVLGKLLSVNGGTLRVEGRDGPVDVPLGSVVAGKPVPPKASRPAPAHLALSVADLELAMAKHWQAGEQEWLGGWLLRASGGFTNRANSVLAVGEPGMPMDVAVTEVVDWYADRGLRPVAAAPEPALEDGDTDQLLAAASAFGDAGWQQVPDTSTAVLTGATGELRGHAIWQQLPEGLTVTADDEPDPAWISQYSYRGQAVPDHGVRLLTSAPRQVFVSVRTGGGETVGVVRGSLAESWAGLTALEIAPAWRRRGLATALVGTIAEWGWKHGARSLFLQVAESNEKALAAYAKAGFTRHHRYSYLAPPS